MCKIPKVIFHLLSEDGKEAWALKLHERKGVEIFQSSETWQPDILHFQSKTCRKFLLMKLNREDRWKSQKDSDWNEQKISLSDDKILPFS